MRQARAGGMRGRPGRPDSPSRRPSIFSENREIMGELGWKPKTHENFMNSSRRSTNIPRDEMSRDVGFGVRSKSVKPASTPATRCGLPLKVRANSLRSYHKVIICTQRERRSVPLRSDLSWPLGRGRPGRPPQTRRLARRPPACR